MHDELKNGYCCKKEQGLILTQAAGISARFRYAATVNLIGLLVIGMCWGLTIPLMKIAVDAGHHPLGLLCWQLAVSVIILGTYLLVKGERYTPDKQTILYIVIIAFLGTLIPNTFQILAFRHLPAGVMAIIISTVPIVSLLVALLVRMEQFSWQRSLGVLLGVMALVLIAIPDASLPDPAKALWLLVALVAPVCYAIEGNFVAARAPAQLSAATVLFFASLFGYVFLQPIVIFAQWDISVSLPLDKSRLALLGSSVGHVVAYGGYLWLLGRAGAVFTSQVAYVVTLTGSALAIVLLGERFSSMLWFALVLILVALTLVRPVSRR